MTESMLTTLLGLDALIDWRLSEFDEDALEDMINWRSVLRCRTWSRR